MRANYLATYGAFDGERLLDLKQRCMRAAKNKNMAVYWALLSAYESYRDALRKKLGLKAIPRQPRW